MKDLNSLELKELLSTYRHHFKWNVKFEEVDMLGIVHNIRYFYWMEWARTDYLNAIEFTKDPANFILNNPLITVHNEIDYYKPLRFNEDFIVYTKICRINKSSLIFENVITNSNDELLASGSSILVNINPKTGESVRINDSIRDLINNYEISKVEIAE